MSKYEIILIKYFFYDFLRFHGSSKKVLRLVIGESTYLPYGVTRPTDFEASTDDLWLVLKCHPNLNLVGDSPRQPHLGFFSLSISSTL